MFSNAVFIHCQLLNPIEGKSAYSTFHKQSKQIYEDPLGPWVLLLAFLFCHQSYWIKNKVTIIHIFSQKNQINNR